MNEMQVFQNPEFGQIRTVEINGEPWFVGKDVAQTLGYKDTVNALKAHVDEEDRQRGWRITTPSGTQDMTIINESGLYSLVLSSKLPDAKKFKRWVTAEVIPSIRKHGAYMTPETLEQAILNPDTMIRLCTELKEEQEKRRTLEQQVQRDAPKVLFHDAVAASADTILIRDLSKLLSQNGVPNMGGTRLYAWLRENGYLCKEGSSYNLPTQKAMELGLFRIRESSRIQNGEILTDKTTRVTGKGQQYFLKKFLSPP